MATKDGSVTAAYPTIGGNGTYSYMKNSTAQGKMGDAAKLFINEAISETLNITNFSTSNAFQIADLGCSIGPNTLSAVQNILEAVKTKYQTQLLNNNKLPEFQVFFNDHASNDFNTLFKSFPKDKSYYASGVPGSFYGRLFPHASLHFVYSSCAITWLSNVPKQVGDKSSAAWNKGRIFYSNADDEVVMAYSNQHAEDKDRFFTARAAKVVCGGLMVIIVPSRPNGVSHLEFPTKVILEILGSCFMDMAKKGIIDEEKVDSFNLPTYNTSPQEVEEAINRNGCFSIEKMETLPQPTLPRDVRIKSRLISMHIRASLEALIKENFGTEILDELFELFMEKLQEELPDLSVLGKAINLFVLLKPKPTEMDP